LVKQQDLSFARYSRSSAIPSETRAVYSETPAVSSE